MALPTDATKVHLDSDADDPKQARSELAELVDKFNALKAELRAAGQLDIGDGLKNDGSTNLAIDLATNSGLDFSGTKLQVKAVKGIQRLANDDGLGLDIDGLAEETAIDLSNDFVAVYDTSVGEHKKVAVTHLGVPTGVTNVYVGATPPTGWILADGGSIGNTGSGASNRAAPDTGNLFKLLWDSMADAQAPVSTGRGASAQADWDSGKNIALPDMRGRVAVGTGGTAPATHGDTGGSETHILAESEMPSHVHQERSGDGFLLRQISGPSFANTIFSFNRNWNNDFDNGPLNTASTGGDGAHENMPPWVALNYIIKL